MILNASAENGASSDASRDALVSALSSRTPSIALTSVGDGKIQLQHPTYVEHLCF